MSKKFQTLNIGASTVELAEYETGSKGALKLLAYGKAQLAASLDGGNAETILVPALMEIVRATGIRPGAVAVAVSGQMVFPRFAAIPSAGGEEKFEQMVRYEVEQNIPFPIDEMVCDRQVLGETENGDKSVLIVAAKIDQVEAITSAVASAGFVPLVVDVAPLAITNVLRHAHPEEGCAILLDIGAKTTSLVIAEGDRIYNRSIPVAGNAITKEIATVLGCSPEEAEQFKLERGYVSLGGVTEDEDEQVDRVSKVCRAVLTRLNAEITRSINFYRSQQGGGTPERLYLTGGTALLPQIDQFFAESLGIEVVYLDPFEAMGVGNKVDAAALESDVIQLGANAGLALHLAGGARFVINLLPPSLIEARAEKARIPFIVAGGFCLAAGLALVMMSFWHDTDVIKAQSQAVQDNVICQLENYANKIKEAEKKCTAAQEEAEAYRDLLSRRAAAAQRVNAVRESLVSGMWIDRWERVGENDSIAVRYWSDRIQAQPGKPVEDAVKAKLKGKTAVVAESVDIGGMLSVGKDGQIRQFTVNLRFK